MKKLQIIRRGFNSRRPFRRLNSAVDLVGKEVEVQDNEGVIQSEVESVTVDASGDTTLELSSGDSVVVDEAETEELLDTGTVVSEDDTPLEETPAPTEEFEVTREVVDASGNAQEVTTKVEAESEDDALETVTMLDARRKRNSRNYFVYRCANSVISETVVEKPETAVDPETKEFKIIRTTECDGKRVRKIASVTAPTVDEAIEAVKAKDFKDGVDAEGYAELIEEMPKESQVTINSDVDEVISEEVPEVETEPIVEETVVEDTVPSESEPELEPEVTEETVIDRESNSFKGVSSFIARKYGIKL